jgi:putative endonuclease
MTASAIPSLRHWCDPMTVQSYDLGRRSEELACDYLKARDWAILDRNYRAGPKEIDIVASGGGTIAFVEVKARSNVTFGHPIHAITWRKRRDLEHAARAWIRTHRHPASVFRFDAITVIWKNGSNTIEHFEDAWRIR